MSTTHYDHLNAKGEPASQFRKRLQAFAILHRFDRASNYQYVASQIVRLDMITEFNAFVVPESLYLAKR